MSAPEQLSDTQSPPQAASSTTTNTSTIVATTAPKRAPQKRLRPCPVCQRQNPSGDHRCVGCGALFSSTNSWTYTSVQFDPAVQACVSSETCFTVTVKKSKASRSDVSSAPNTQRLTSSMAALASPTRVDPDILKIFPAREHDARCAIMLTVPLSDMTWLLSNLNLFKGIFGSMDATSIATASDTPITIQIGSISHDIYATAIHMLTSRGDMRVLALKDFSAKFASPIKPVFFLVEPLVLDPLKATAQEENLFNMLANPQQVEAALANGTRLLEAYISFPELIIFFQSCLKMYDVEDGRFIGGIEPPMHLLKGLCALLNHNRATTPTTTNSTNDIAMESPHQQPTFFRRSWNECTGVLSGLSIRRLPHTTTTTTTTTTIFPTLRDEPASSSSSSAAPLLDRPCSPMILPPVLGEHPTPRRLVSPSMLRRYMGESTAASANDLGAVGDDDDGVFSPLFFQERTRVREARPTMSVDVATAAAMPRMTMSMSTSAMPTMSNAPFHFPSSPPRKLMCRSQSAPLSKSSDPRVGFSYVEHNPEGLFDCRL